MTTPESQSEAKPKAYSYVRFSTPEQMRGDSMRRQSALAESYAQRHGLELDNSLSLNDYGVSAFRAKNARHGALGTFLRAIDDGLVPEGSYLLVENLDRVSRADPWDALPLFQQIVNAGVTIVTLQDERVWSREGMREQPMRIMESLFVMIRANEESQAKSRRLSATWEHKRSRATDKPLTRVCPKWLRMRADGAGFEVIPERGAVVQRIYQLCLEGCGLERIAERLNEENVPTFGRAEFWRRSYVKKIVDSPAVVGTYVPHKWEGDGERRWRKPLDPVEGYFPAVVSRDNYEAVRAQRHGLRVPAASEGRPVVNLFAALGRCPACGASMTRVHKGRKGGQPKLVCSKAKVGGGCQYRSVAQADAESALIDGARELCLNPPVGIADIDSELRREEVALEEVRDRIHTLAAEIAEQPSPSLRAKLSELETERDDIEKNISKLRDLADATSGAAVRARCEALLSALEANEVDKAKANSHMRQLFSAVVIDWQSGQLQLHWRHGGESYLQFGWPEQAPSAS